METLPLITLIFYSIPESYLIFSFGLVVQRKALEPAQIALATICSVSASYFARLLPLPFGFHILIGVLVVFMLFLKILKLSPKQSLFSTFLSLGTLAALENSVLCLIQYNFSISLKDLIALPPWHKTIIGWPHLAIWATLTLLISKRYKQN